jgi:hypothetical protein
MPLITEVSADALAIAAHLAATPVGAVVSHATLTGIIGREIREHRHLFYTAARIAQREHGAVFVTERGTGYRRLAPEAVAAVVGPAARNHIRRTARLGQRAIAAGTAKMNDAAPAVQRQIAAELSALGLVEHMARDAVTKPAEDGPTKAEPVAVAAKRFLATIGATP